MKKAILTEALIGLIVIMFLYASFSKYFDLKTFIRTMHSQPFPSWFASFLIIVLPGVEIATVLLLIFENTRVFGLKITIIMMSCFTIYIIAILSHFFPKVPCSCGGIIKLLTWEQHLIFNLFFLLIAIISWRLTMTLQIKNQALIDKNISRAKSG